MQSLLFKPFTFCAIAILFETQPLSAAQVQSTGTEVLHSFNYKGVRLLDSHWQRQQTDILDYYLAVPTDNYLIGFRKRAGKPAPGTELGGWYSSDTFNTFGQIVSGLARFYAATGDARAKAKVDEMIAGFVECIEADGYHFYSRKTNAPHYEFDKFLGGLIDASIYCENRQAHAAMSPITDWAIKNLDPDPKYPRPRGQANVEGYTLSENLYRAYLLTGDKKYEDFAKHWDYWAWWDKFKEATPTELFKQPSGNVLPYYHAYSHVNSLNGLAAGYMATRESRYLTPLKNAYDYLKKSQTYATGGYGPMERIANRKFLEAAIDWSDRHFETQCGSWAVFKLSKYLESLTGDARYGGWAEEMVYNGIGGSMQMAENGDVQYFSNYSSRGGTKVNRNPWSCCTGTRPQAAADYTDLVYFHDDASIYINLFLPSKLDWNHNGSTVSLKMETTFPAEETVRIKIDSAIDTTFTINVRKPDWLSGEAEFRVNGQAVSTIATSKNWFPVSRQWKAADTLEFRMPMKLLWKPFNNDKPFPGAVTYGPVALAWEMPFANPADGRTPTQLIAGLKRTGDKSLSWNLEGDPSINVCPWYLVNPNDKYFIYLDPSAGDYANLSPNWKTNENHMTADAPGATAKFEFVGTGIRLHWTKFDDAGIAEINIDGKTVGKIDQYGLERGVDATTDYSSLPLGKHTISIINTGEKNEVSKAKVINIARIEVLNNPVETELKK